MTFSVSSLPIKLMSRALLFPRKLHDFRREEATGDCSESKIKSLEKVNIENNEIITFIDHV